MASIPSIFSNAINSVLKSSGENKQSNFTNGPLVYPRQLPRQVPNTDSGIRGDDNYETEYLDYLRITIYKTQGSNGANPYTWAGGDGGGGFKEPYKGANASSISKTIYLYLPVGLNEQYSTNYNVTALGAAGVGAINAGTGSVNSKEDAVTIAQQTAGTAKPSLVMDKAAAALGAVGSSADANDLLAVASKKVFNPYQETTFKGVNYRDHAFNFKFAPRNAREAKECYEIISTLRTAMLPSTGNQNDFGNLNEGIADVLTSQSGYLGGTRFLNIPDIMRLSIVRMSTTDNKSRIPAGIARIVRFPTKCVLSTLSVNTSPDGQYNSLKDGADTSRDYGPAAMDVSMTFKETQFITREMVRP